MDDRKDKEQQLFRKKALDRISSPDQLTDYLHVTSPGIWIMLTAVIVLLAGILVWASVGTLETTVDAKAVVSDGKAEVLEIGAYKLEAGMTLRIKGRDFELDLTDKDEYGREVGFASVSLADGTYDAKIVTEKTRPIEFLLTAK